MKEMKRAVFLESLSVQVQGKMINYVSVKLSEFCVDCAMKNKRQGTKHSGSDISQACAV